MNNIECTLHMITGEQRIIDLDPNNILEELYSHIGCELIEAAYVSDDTVAIVDEEGLFTGKQPNPFYPSLVGNVVTMPARIWEAL